VVSSTGGAGRVIAGSARGIRLVAPGQGTRPLGDRAKQTCFAILEPDLPGAAFLDLFAGSGAAGIEALSRGAARAVFVERDRAALRAIDDNLRRTRLAGERALVIRADAPGWLAADGPAAGPFDIAFVDPPYDDPASLDAALRRLGDPDVVGRLLAPGGRVVAKHARQVVPRPTVGLLASERERGFGATVLTFYRVAPPPGQEDR
jgi:16S rRNA (guanine(966)-N(2))-methyltransferase RsmD